MTPGCWFFCGGVYGALLTAAVVWWLLARRRRRIEALQMSCAQFCACLERRCPAAPRAPRRPAKTP